MAVLKCTICGGELEVNSDLSIGVCQYCGSTIMIPKELDRKGNLYNRAVFLRQNNEFDKAVATYEDILKEDNADAEAHWGLVLCKYGIEYVSDPQTNEHVPTCHRVQAESILTDPDYLAALEYADWDAKKIIEKEAKRISEIQAKILEISRKEPPYDIFICYKETDESGNRTEDSVLAQELYYELIEKDYKVFFSRKTLESKLGDEYEPIIYAALSSAKVMIVLGTKPEHFNAVWVRNEWSRFLKMCQGSRKIVIPAYRGMSPYELPVELSALQSEDMAKLGFMQDLIDGIERCLREETRQKEEQKKVTAASLNADSLERLLQNGQTYLKLKNYTSAEEVYTKITKDYPEDHRGWWGLIVCKTRDFTNMIPDQSELNLWFSYAKQLTNPELFEELKRKYVDYTLKLAGLDAAEDMESVNDKMDHYNSQIQNIEEQIKNSKNSIAQLNEDFRRQTEEKEILSIEMKIGDCKRTIAQTMKKPVIGTILIIIGVLWFWVSSYAFQDQEGAAAFGQIILGLFFGSGGYVLWKSFITTRTNLNKRIEELQKEIELVPSKRTEKKQELDKKISGINMKISDFEENISRIQSKIADCRMYLDLGKSKIAEYWLAVRCSDFGVQQSVDKEIVECRDKVFNGSDNNL